MNSKTKQGSGSMYWPNLVYVGLLERLDVRSFIVMSWGQTLAFPHAIS